MQLTPLQEEFVKARLTAGEYSTPNEVITEALSRMDRDEQEYAAWVKQELSLGMSELERGECAPLEPLGAILAEARVGL